MKAGEASRNGSSGDRTAAARWAGAGGLSSTAAPTLPTCTPHEQRLSQRRSDGTSRAVLGGGGGGFPAPPVIRAQDTGCTAQVRPAVGALGPGGRRSLAGLTVQEPAAPPEEGAGPEDPAWNAAGGDLLVARPRGARKGSPLHPRRLPRWETRGGGGGGGGSAVCLSLAKSCPVLTLRDWRGF